MSEEAVENVQIVDLVHFAQKLVVLINKFDKKRYFENIIDIGSGKGDITNWISTQIEYGHLFGIDVSPESIGIAELNTKIQTIEYVLTDLSEDWHLVDQSIKSLQSKVSLTFSNFCIHYIKQKLQFVQNLRKLVAPGARAYFSVTLIPDPTFKLTNELKEKFGRYVKTPPIDQQLKTWTDLFKANGFVVEYQEIESIPVSSKGNNDIFLYWYPKHLQVFHENGITWGDLSDDIRNSLIRVTADQSLTQNSVDCKTLDRFKNEWNENLRVIYNVGYLVCKAIN